MITTQQLRQKYLDFFQKRGHTIIPSASLIPENDPTVLFTTAGMHPLVVHLTGQKHPAGQRLTNSQKCLRTGDIDEVGDNVHLTFFEMLGNWSLGDYGKKEAIEWSYEFLTRELKIPVARLAISCFQGDDQVAKDEESAKIWQSLGLPKDKIYFYGREQNWWGPAGQTGPCGPDTEIYYDTGKKQCPQCAPNGPACDCGKFVEIWNDVFMQYDKQADGSYQELKQKNVDTGMGLERTVAILNGFDNVFSVEPLATILEEVADLFNFKVKDLDPGQLRAAKIIADHLRAATFILAENIEPSNLERGYVLRRLIRRAIRYGKELGITETFTFQVAESVIKAMSPDYPELKDNQDFIIEQLVREEEKFADTLERGLREFEKKYKIIVGGNGENMSKKKAETKWTLPDYVAFDLFTSYGFPIELTQEIAADRGMAVDIKGFEKKIKEHQELSRTATAGKFKGGLADHSQETTRLHTTNHLVLAALRKIVGEHIYQKGSNITAERLRFDFSQPAKLTTEQIKQVEDLVNKKIKEKLPVSWEIMPLKKARALGAMGVFDQKYQDQVKIYTVGDPKNPFSRELCGGPHVGNTGELGHFKIIKEEASSAGIRRIKAVLE